MRSIKKYLIKNLLLSFRLFSFLILMILMYELGMQYIEYGENGKENKKQSHGNMWVQILNDEYQDTDHEIIRLKCEESFEVRRYSAKKNTPYSLDTASEFEIHSNELEKGDIVCITPKERRQSIIIESLKRAQGQPGYYGKLFLIKAENGIWILNEIELEDYLISVVASEMPSAYPTEAQKAQAVCARSYAVIKRTENGRTGKEDLESMIQSAMIRADEIRPDLDDSVSCQVYNNYQGDSASAAAVYMTEGEILSLEEVRYYSTACGASPDQDLHTEAAFKSFLDKKPRNGTEYDSPWLRWNLFFEESQVRDRILQCQENWIAQCNGEHQAPVWIASRKENGQVEKMIICDGISHYSIEGEYQIRKFLIPGETKVHLNNAMDAENMSMLPSAWFYIEWKEEKLLLYGGGYGHGIGMSQCGAAALAKKGKNYLEILDYYYHITPE